MVKIVINFEYIPTFDDLSRFLKGCHYDLYKLFFKDGTWELPTNDILGSEKISGLGLFHDPTDRVPAFVFNHKSRCVYILDAKLLRQANNSTKVHCVYIRVSSKKAFAESFDFDSMFYVKSGKE